jgi:hypothetical protein
MIAISKTGGAVMTRNFVVAGTRLVLFLAFTLAAYTAQAGQLILKNTSNSSITCTVDGYTVATGWPFDWTITVQPNVPFSVGPTNARPINWATCQGLTAQPLYITQTGPNGTLVFNGQQTRVLNASLYAYIPNVPGSTFENLVNQVIQTYQQQNPQVLLNAVMNQDVPIYDFASLPGLFGATGFNTVELDTVMLGTLVSQNLINPAQISGDAPLAQARAGSTINNQLWGVPSWLCTNFIYSANGQITQVTNLGQLLTFLNQMPSGKPKLVGDFNGNWNLPSMYINGYVQTYGYGAIGNAMKMPPDPTVINNIVAFTDTCTSNNTNNCTNNYYHNQANGTTEQVFATGNASDDMGFSEQSFYVFYYGWNASLYVTVAQWGSQNQPLLYSDTFTTSRATCGPGSACATDATALSTLMTSAAMKNYIVKGQDLPQGSPWRTLLVATQPFYSQPEIMNNAMYQQFTRVFNNGQAYVNNFTAATQQEMTSQICAALQAQRSDYYCKSAALPAPQMQTRR